MIKVKNLNTLSEQGKRSNNEDNFGYIDGFVYLVCDGVGGAEKGEIASALTVKSFVDVFKKDKNASIEDALIQAEINLTHYLQENPSAAGMATTLTFSQIRENDIRVAWVGDSRIYHFRKGAIKFKSTDHSWVNEALLSGILTEEEAVNHPKSNVITRAVQGAHKPVSADIQILEDIIEGDYIFQCSDGILESWTDLELADLFQTNGDPQDLIEIIKEKCQEKSRDNFTALIYQIAQGATSVTVGYVNDHRQVLEAELVNDPLSEFRKGVDINNQSSKNLSNNYPKRNIFLPSNRISIIRDLTLIVFVSAFTLLIYNYCSPPKSSDVEKQSVPIQNPTVSPTPKPSRPHNSSSDNSNKKLNNSTNATQTNSGNHSSQTPTSQINSSKP